MCVNSVMMMRGFAEKEQNKNNEEKINILTAAIRERGNRHTANVEQKKNIKLVLRGL